VFYMQQLYRWGGSPCPPPPPRMLAAHKCARPPPAAVRNQQALLPACRWGCKTAIEPDTSTI